MTDPTYATVAEVSGSLILATKGLTPETISGSILRAEGIIDSILQKSGRGTSPDYTFDLAKHGIIKDAAISLAALDLLVADVEEFAGTSTAGLTADILWAKANRDLILLMSPAVSKFIEGL